VHRARCRANARRGESPAAAWFERTASAAQVKTIYRFKTDKLDLPDDFDPAPEW